MIDALLNVAERHPAVGVDLDPDERLILVAAHHRENCRTPFLAICRALRTLLKNNDGARILYPIHSNPNTKEVAHEMLGGRPDIILCPPLDYQPYVRAMLQAYLILSDSGGVQEEAPALGKPVLV